LKNNKKISVVCASHKGCKKLPNLISSISINTINPFEIILCVTSLEDTKFIPSNHIKDLNIKIIVSKIFDQSHQRKLAIKKAKGDYIIQLDDDLILQKDTIEKFINHFNDNNNKKVISAVVLLPNKKLQSNRWNTLFNKNILFRLLIFLLNGFEDVKSMSILKSGRIAPLLFFNDNTKIIDDAEWLNSCIIYNKKAINEAEYLKGGKSKAYFEDVFFSHSLYKNNYKLIVDSAIKVNHHFVKPTNIFTYFNLIRSQYIIVKTFHKSLPLFFLDVLIFINLYLVSSLLILFQKRDK